MEIYCCMLLDTRTFPQISDVQTQWKRDHALAGADSPLLIAHLGLFRKRISSSKRDCPSKRFDRSLQNSGGGLFVEWPNLRPTRKVGRE